jgi:outer membrane biosynthesis protein TonB
MPRVRLVLLLIIAAFSAASAQQIPPGSSKGEVVPVSLAKPVYPKLARQADLSGEVTVSLTVQDGTTEAVVVSGHPMLKQAALGSARQSRFECRMCSAPVSYLLVYTFKQAEGTDCCIAFT